MSRQSAKLVISDPTDNVTFTIVGIPTYTPPEQEGSILTATQFMSIAQDGSTLTVE